jgi:hypothetical protein
VALLFATAPSSWDWAAVAAWKVPPPAHVPQSAAPEQAEKQDKEVMKPVFGFASAPP